MSYEVGDVVVCVTKGIHSKLRERGFGWEKDRVFTVTHINYHKGKTFLFGELNTNYNPEKTPSTSQYKRINGGISKDWVEHVDPVKRLARIIRKEIGL
jgi:hypothetical protein